MGVARPQALLPAPVVSYTTISPLLPEERYVSVARSGRSLRPGRYPTSRFMECGLSSPCEQGATTWLTWGFHNNMFRGILVGGILWGTILIYGLSRILIPNQWGGQNHLHPLKCSFGTIKQIYDKIVPGTIGI